MTAHERRLERLEALLRRRTLTAREIARELGCSKPAAYERVRALIDRGVAVFQVRAPRAGGTGPAPVAYGIKA